jgi:putative flippase GtrA
MPRRLVSFFLRDRRLFVRYVSVGAISALIEWGVFTLLLQGFGWPLFLSNGLALGLSILVNFLLHRNWTFAARSDAGAQVGRYLLMQIVAVTMNNGLIWLFIQQLGWYPPLAKGIEIALVFLWSFSVSRRVVFPDRRVARP